MEYRATLSEKPADENPSFYLLIIGDILLRQDKIDEAVKAYADADASKVHPGLISDRYRTAAHWYETHEQLEKAVEILKAHRELDPLLFDAMLDRVSRELTTREEAKS